MRVSLTTTKLRSKLEYDQNCIHIAKYSALFYDAEKVCKANIANITRSYREMSSSFTKTYRQDGDFT